VVELNEFFFALGNFFLAIAGFLTYYIESLSLEKIANSIARKENIPPTEAVKKAEEKKNKLRSAILIPWAIGILLNGIGFLL
jgi:hypothetical protein